LRDLGSKERILRLWLRLCPGLLLRLLRLLRLPLIQDFKSGSILALITDNLESSCLVQESVTAFDIPLRILGLCLEGAVRVLEAKAVRPVLVDLVVLPDEFGRSGGGCRGVRVLRGAARRADHGSRDRQSEKNPHFPCEKLSIGALSLTSL